MKIRKDDKMKVNFNYTIITVQFQIIFVADNLKRFQTCKQFIKLVNSTFTKHI